MVKIGNWWQYDMSDASQRLFSDPSTAIEAATTPPQLLVPDPNQQATEQQARVARSGLVGETLDLFGKVLGKTDAALSHVGVGDLNAANGLKYAMWPVDKSASGLHWLFSNGVSQPLSTLLLMSGTSEGSPLKGSLGSGATSYFSASDWAKTWHKANNISPGQAVGNLDSLSIALGKGDIVSSLIGGNANNLDDDQKKRISQQADRFVYDTNYWKKVGGNRYNIGTGLLDMGLDVKLDIGFTGLKLAGAAVKGARTVKIAGTAEKSLKVGKITGAPKWSDLAASKIAQKFELTPQEAAQSKYMQKTFQWMDGKTRAEIEAHPMWGSTRATMNPMKSQWSELYSQADSVERPLLFRIGAGDNDALTQLAFKNQGLLTQLGRAQDNRRLVASVASDPEFFEHFIAEERAGRTAPSNPFGPGIGGTSPTQFTPTGSLYPRLTEPPYPRPLTPGPRQAGWDALYGRITDANGNVTRYGLQEKANVFRKAAGDILTSSNGVRPMGTGAANTTLADVVRFQHWHEGTLATIDAQVGTMMAKGGKLADLMGSAAEHPDEVSPGASNLFGTMKTIYRTGPLAFKDSELAADKRFLAANQDRLGRQTEGGFAARTIRSGYYNIPLRFVQAWGDKLPQTLINHNLPDSNDRFLAMLKRVPGLGAEARMGMLNTYSNAADKVAKSKVLADTRSAIVAHMSAGKNLNAQSARAIDEMIHEGTNKAYNELQGKQGFAQMAPAKSPAFNPAINTATGHQVDHYDPGNGEAWKVGPAAKTQLSYSEPLLDVDELRRFLNRNSGSLQELQKRGQNMRQATGDVVDNLSNVWKATTLLRPGYLLRAPSDEIVASAIKFGILSSVMASVHGGANFARNRQQQITALLGQGSYASATGTKTRLAIRDPQMAKISKQLMGKTTRINVSDAWPFVRDRIDSEQKLLKPIQQKIIKMQKDPNHDPAILQDLMDQVDDHKTIIQEHTDYMHHLLNVAEDAKGQRYGEGVFTHLGQPVPQTFSREWNHPISREDLSSDNSFQTMFARGESIDTARAMKTGTWDYIASDHPNYMPSLLDALNHQWAQDDLYHLVLNDPSMQSAKSFLHTPQGATYLHDLGPQGRDVKVLLQGVRDTIDHYTAHSPVLQDKMAKKIDITKADIHAAIHPDDLPMVNGEEVLGYTRKGADRTLGYHVDNIINKGFHALGTIPTDILSRNPTFARAHEARMRELMDEEASYQAHVGKPATDFTAKQLNDMHKKAATLARNDIRSVVYDPQRTTATQALRFISPFLSAYKDGLERWSGIIAEKPQVVGQASRIYNAPVAAHLITDSEGNQVDENGNVPVYDKNGKVVGHKFVDINNRTIHVKAIPGTRGLTKFLTGGGNEVPIKLSTLNTILPGDPWWNPGTGPVVSIPASVISSKSPATGDFLQWAKVLPFGPTGVMDSITPAYMKDVWDAFQPNGDKFQAAALADYQRQQGEYHDGALVPGPNKAPIPDLDRAKKNARTFMFLKAITNWASPARVSTTPLTGTKYQFYVDQLKKFQNADPKTADENFISRYGSDLFAFTASMSKSIGIAPTLSALATSEKYKPLIDKDPSLAAFIVGDTYNQGKFSTSAYSAQQNQYFGGQQARGKQSVEDALNDAQRRLGWVTYGKVMNTINANLIRAGFHSYNQLGAQQFLAVKQNAEQQLRQLYPAWEQDFDTTDKGAVGRRIQSFQHLVLDPSLANDPMRSDIPILKQYLQGRTYFKNQLALLGASQLSQGVSAVDQNGQTIGGLASGKTAALAQQWRSFQTSLVNADTKFGDVFTRYLSNDNLQ